MAEETTITDGGSSPSETTTQEPAWTPVYLDAPDPEESDDNLTADAEPTDVDEAGKKKDLESRYDKDPEFKKAVDRYKEKERLADEKIRLADEKLKSGNDQTIKQLMDKIAALEGKIAPKKDEPLDFKPIQNMTAEELRDWRDEDPIGYEQNRLKQFMHEITNRLPKFDEEAVIGNLLKRLTQMGQQKESEKTAEAAKATITKFAEDHPDMEDLVPQIIELRKKEPWRDAISAYWAIKGTGPDFQKEVDAAVEKAKQDWLKQGADKVTPPIKPGPAAQRSSPTEIKRRPNETLESYVSRRADARMAKLKG